jgi:hypothetical protein
MEMYLHLYGGPQMSKLARLADTALTFCLGLVAVGLRSFDASFSRMTEERRPIPVRVDEVRRTPRR